LITTVNLADIDLAIIPVLSQSPSAVRFPGKGSSDSPPEEGEHGTVNKGSDCGVVGVPVVHTSRPVLAHLYLVSTKVAIVVSIQLQH